MPRWKRACCALPVNGNLLCFPVDHVRFDFRHIVGDVVDYLHIERVGWALEYLRERFSRPVGYHLSVDECEVAGSGHCGDVVLGLWTLAGACSQFSIGKLDVVLVDRSLHHSQVVAAGLVTIPSTTCMNQNKNLAFLVNAEAFCDALIEDLVGSLDLNEMVSTA